MVCLCPEQIWQTALGAKPLLNRLLASVPRGVDGLYALLLVDARTTRRGVRRPTARCQIRVCAAS